MSRYQFALLVFLAINSVGADASHSVAQVQCPPAMTFTGETAGESFGFDVSGAGDVNNDGFDDLIVGAYSSGIVYVYSGPTGALLHTFVAETTSDLFGYSVSGAGDVNNDGFSDIIIGAYMYADATGPHAGRAYVYSGQSGLLLYTFDAEEVGDHFGISVSGAGDVDNDGYSDLLIGANRNDLGGIDAGRAYVYSGQTSALLYSFAGSGVNDYFGIAVSDAGDIDNDGFPDLLVGATTQRFIHRRCVCLFRTVWSAVAYFPRRGGWRSFWRLRFERW